jgi:hypothetical protein
MSPMVSQTHQLSRLLNRRLSPNDPARIMRFHADMRVVASRRRGCEQNQMRMQPARLVRPSNQLTANATLLVRLVDCEV